MRKYGLDDQGIVELMAVVDLFSGYNKLVDGLQVEPDEKPHELERTDGIRRDRGSAVKGRRG